MPGQTAVENSPSSALLRRSFRKTFPPAVRGDGVYLWDAQGKRYLDFSGSAAVNFIGHGVAEIVAAMTSQAASLEFVHGSQFTTPIAEEYAHKLLDFAGEGFRGGAVYFTSGGSEAIETALKLARQYQVEIGQTERSQTIDDGWCPMAPARWTTRFLGQYGCAVPAEGSEKAHGCAYSRGSGKGCIKQVAGSLTGNRSARRGGQSRTAGRARPRNNSLG